MLFLHGEASPLGKPVSPPEVRLRFPEEKTVELQGINRPEDLALLRGLLQQGDGGLLIPGYRPEPPRQLGEVTINDLLLRVADQRIAIKSWHEAELLIEVSELDLSKESSHLSSFLGLRFFTSSPRVSLAVLQLPQRVL